MHTLSRTSHNYDEEKSNNYHIHLIHVNITITEDTSHKHHNAGQVGVGGEKEGISVPGREKVFTCLFSGCTQPGTRVVVIATVVPEIGTLHPVPNPPGLRRGMCVNISKNAGK